VAVIASIWMMLGLTQPQAWLLTGAQDEGRGRVEGARVCNILGMIVVRVKEAVFFKVCYQHPLSLSCPDLVVVNRNYI